jgi:ParB/RepB/Spo0J family partition protein
MTTDLATPKVAIDRIHIVEDFNARKSFDKEELKQMARTIEDTGIVQPVKVKERDDGDFDLVAGERRFRAAKIAGRKEIEITLSTGNPVTESLIENIQRSNLNPIETGIGLKAYAEEHNLETNKQIAAKVGKRAEWIGAHLGLLKLPKKVQRYIAAGDVPMEAASLLRPVAEISPQIAALICEAGKREDLSGRRFIERFGQLFEALPRNEELKNVPTMISVPCFHLSEVVPEFNPAENKEHEELMHRALDAFYGYKVYNPTDAEVCLAEPEIDAARAAGVLLEHHEDDYTRAFILDRDLAVDLIGRAIERRTKEREEKAKAREEEQERLKEQRKSNRRQAKEERKASGEPSPQAKAKADAEYAVRCNDAVGRNLLERRSGGKDKKHALRRAKLVAHLFVDQNDDLAGRGLRFTVDKLRDVQRTELKKGGFKVKVTYATDEECTAELRRRIDAARSETEVMEVVTEAIVAAELADNKAEPASRRPQWIGRYEKGKETEKILKAELKEARPRKPRRVQQKAAK